MVAPAATSPFTFVPGDTLAEAILIDLASPHASLSSVAAKHHIPTATLSLWLTKPETQALLHAIESGGYAHTRLAAALNLSAAVPVLLQILADFRTLSQSTTDLTDPAYQRASVSARKAAWMLLRLARSHPLTPEQLSAVRTTLNATRTTTRDASAAPTPAPVPEAPAPIAPAHIATTTATPIAPLQTPTPVTRIEPEDAQPAPVPTVAALPTPTNPALTAAPVASTTTHTGPAPHIPHNPPDDLADLVVHLSSIAESLGIDISQLDQLDHLDDLDTLDDLNGLTDLPATAHNNATGPPDPEGTPARLSA